MMDVWFLVFPPLLFFLFKILWLDYANKKYLSRIKWVLLEIIPPRDVEKSPLPMESIFAGFAGVIKTPTVAETWVEGEIPVSFSLELVSLEGEVHLYVYVRAGCRNLVEAHFYAQYPDVEIVEAPDYTHNVPKTIPNKDWDIWGIDFGLAKDDLYPIKTYKYFEESVTGKMIDPLAGIFETMGKLGPGQNLWLQFIITPLKENWYPTGQGTVDMFLGRVKKEKMGILMSIFTDIKDVFMNLGRGLTGQEVEFTAVEEKEETTEQPVEFRLTPGEKEVLKALEANLGKQMFKTRMRYMYIARREVFSKATGVSSFLGGIKQFNDQNLNSFKPLDESKTDADYVFVEQRLRYRQRRLFRRYVDRDTDPQDSLFLLSSEELATVFHIPDMAVSAPSLTRVTAKRVSAPGNLPIQE